MDAAKINKYAYNIVSLTWPKYKKHMGDRDRENIKIVEDMLIKFQNELTIEFISANKKEPVSTQKQQESQQTSSNKYEVLSIVTFKSNFKTSVIPPFQTWKRGSEMRITDFRLKNDPTIDPEQWSETVYNTHTILEETDENKIKEGIRKYYPDAEILHIEQIFKDKLNLTIFPNFRGVVSL